MCAGSHAARAVLRAHAARVHDPIHLLPDLGPLGLRTYQSGHPVAGGVFTSAGKQGLRI